MAAAVPIYQAPQVRTDLGQPVYRQPNTQVDEAAMRFGGALGAAASDMQQVEMKAGQLQAEERLNQLREKQIEKTGWVKSLLGKDAFDKSRYGGEQDGALPKTASTWFQDDTEEAGKGLTGYAAQAFRMGAQRFKIEFDSHVQDHVARQALVRSEDVFTSGVAKEGQSLAISALRQDGSLDLGTIAQSIERTKSLAAENASIMGKDPEHVTRQALTQLHSVVFQKLIDNGKTTEAGVYLASYKEQMDAKLILEMQHKVDVKSGTDAVQAAVDEHVAPYLGDENQRDGVPETGILQNIAQDARFKGKPELAKLAEAQAKELISAQRKDWLERTGKLTGDVMAAWNARKNSAAALGSPSGLALAESDPTAYAKLEEHFKNQAQNDPAKIHRQAAAFYEAVRNPDKWKTATPGTIAGQWDRFGPYTEKLQQWVLELGQPGKMVEAKADQQDLNTALYDLKIDPLKDKEQATRFQQFVETAIGAAEEDRAREKKAPLSRAEKALIIQNAKKKVPFWSPGFFGGGVSEDFGWNLQPEQMTTPPKDDKEVDAILQDKANRLKQKGIKWTPNKMDRWDAWQALVEFRKQQAPTTTDEVLPSGI